MLVQLLYFDGCPHWREMEDLLRRALDLSGVTATIEHVHVDTQEAADRHGFVGSPSLLLDQRDPFRSSPGAFGLTCRVYPTPGGPGGTPTLEQLLEVVSEAAE